MKKCRNIQCILLLRREIGSLETVHLVNSALDESVIVGRMEGMNGGVVHINNGSGLTS